MLWVEWEINHRRVVVIPPSPDLLIPFEVWDVRTTTTTSLQVNAFIHSRVGRWGRTIVHIINNFLPKDQKLG